MRKVSAVVSVMTQRSVSTLAIPPVSYGEPRGAFWAKHKELERFPPMYAEAQDVFDEYLRNKSLAPNKHQEQLRNSTGLLELHYNTMRKNQMNRAAAPAWRQVPTMDRSYEACSGYGGFIPGKESKNICGCTFSHASKIALDTRGKFFHPPMSGWYSTIKRANSTPQLGPNSAIPPEMTPMGF